MRRSFAEIRDDFPVLRRQVNGRPLVYLDNAASSLTPLPVLEAMDSFYREHRANVHRGLHTLSMEATELYEGARTTVARFIGAGDAAQVVFTRGATAAINLVARGWAMTRLRPGDAIVVSRSEHHANLVPWQMVCARTGAELRFIELGDRFTYDLASLDRVLDERVKLLSLAHVSNVLGAINPIQAVFSRARALGAATLLDAAQSVGHMPVDFESLGCDFLAFSGHKICGPTGIGCLVGSPRRLDEMDPTEGGGDMILEVGWRESTWNGVPHRFEAGTPPIAEAIGLGAACDYLEAIGLERIREHTQQLTEAAVAALEACDGVTVFGPRTGRLGPVAFSVEGCHPHDVAQIVDLHGVAIRAGHHCAQPLHSLFSAPSTARASFYLVNQPSDIDRLVEALAAVREVFGRVC